MANSLRTNIAVPTEPWEQARTRFLADLSEDERSLYETASVETIFYQANVGHRQYQQSSKLQAARKRLMPFINALDGWGKGVDVIAGQSAGSFFLAPIWGACRVVIYMAKEYDDYFHKLIDMLEKIGKALPQFQDYQRIFANHERLLQAISDAYLSVVRFCVDAKVLFKQANAHKTSNRLVFKISARTALKSQWKPFVEKFQAYLGMFEAQKDLVDKEALLAHMMEEKKEQEQQEKSRALLRLDQRQKGLRRCLARLAPVQYQAQLRRFQSMRHPGTGTWIFKEESFDLWAGSPQSSCFYCTGIPGSGKTILASGIFKKVAEDYSHAQDLAACFFCEYSDVSTLQAKNILGVLIKQMLESRTPTTELAEWVLEHCGADQLLPTREDLLEIIIKTLSSFSRVFLVLDGIDELDSAEQGAAYDIIKQLLSIDRCSIKIFISCRPNALPSKWVTNRDRSLSISLDHVSNDLSQFVAHSVDQAIESGDLTLGDPSLRQEIVDSLREGAQDMFLWAKFQILEICETDNDEAIRNVLCDLPNDVATTYDRILLRISSSTGGKAKAKAAMKVFMWVASARRPLSVDELKEAVAIDPDDERLHMERIPSDDGTKLIRSCGNLVVVDAYDQTVRLAHHTVRQYLDEIMNRQRMEWFPFGQTGDASFDSIVGRLCITYLFFSDFESQLVLRDQKSPMLETQSEYMNPIMWAPLIGNTARSILGFRTGQKDVQKLNLHLPGVLQRQTSHGGIELMQKYKLLGYVVQNWAYHIHQENSSRVWDLCFNKTFPFEIRPWQSLPYSSFPDNRPPKDQALVRWALDNGVDFFFGFIFDWSLDKLDPCLMFEAYHETNTRSLLSRATNSGSISVMRMILEWIRAKFRGHFHFPILMIYHAAAVSQGLMLSSLIDQLWRSGWSITFRETPEAQPFWNSTSPVWFGQPWKEIQAPYDEDFIKDALLGEAAKAGNLPLVDRLLQLGAHPRRRWRDSATVMESASMSPLHWATYNGHWEVSLRLSEESWKRTPKEHPDATILTDSFLRNQLCEFLNDPIGEGLRPGVLSPFTMSYRRSLAEKLKEHPSQLGHGGESVGGNVL